MKKANKKITLTIEILVLLVLTVVSLTPIYWGVVTSLKQVNEINAFPPKIFGFVPTLTHYERILSSGFCCRRLKNVAK